MQMNIVALVGSVRKESYNMKLVKLIQERYKDKFQFDIADIGRLPHYNQDDELNPPEVVAAFKRQIAAADGVLIVTPEYNWSVPGVLKNALDWLSRVDKVLTNKPVMTAGVSGGMMGTIRAQLHLRQICFPLSFCWKIKKQVSASKCLLFILKKKRQGCRFFLSIHLFHITNHRHHAAHSLHCMRVRCMVGFMTVKDPISRIVSQKFDVPCFSWRYINRVSF